MSRKRVADAFIEIEKAREDIKKLKLAVTTTAVVLLVSVSTLSYIISQIQ
jgi:hypothetical protein